MADILQSEDDSALLQEDGFAILLEIQTVVDFTDRIVIDNTDSRITINNTDGRITMEV